METLLIQVHAHLENGREDFLMDMIEAEDITIVPVLLSKLYVKEQVLVPTSTATKKNTSCSRNKQKAENILMTNKLPCYLVR